MGVKSPAQIALYDYHVRAQKIIAKKDAIIADLTAKLHRIDALSQLRESSAMLTADDIETLTSMARKLAAKSTCESCGEKKHGGLLWTGRTGIQSEEGTSIRTTLESQMRCL